MGKNYTQLLAKYVQNTLMDHQKMTEDKTKRV
jgi:hypothetical protein